MSRVSATVRLAALRSTVFDVGLRDRTAVNPRCYVVVSLTVRVSIARSVDRPTDRGAAAWNCWTLRPLRLPTNVLLLRLESVARHFAPSNVLNTSHSRSAARPAMCDRTR